MFLGERIYFLPDVFQITAIALVSVMNPYYINGLHLFWDTLSFDLRSDIRIKIGRCFILLKKNYPSPLYIKELVDIWYKKHIFTQALYHEQDVTQGQLFSGVKWP